MGTSDPGRGNHSDSNQHAGAGEDIPKRPADTNAGGEAKNDTGEDNQRQKGERPADDYVRR
jgi:hypothetical protein